MIGVKPKRPEMIHPVTMMRGLTFGFASLAVLLCAAPTMADEGDAARGHEFAVKYCSRCHAVERHKLKSPVREAPPFATFSRYWPLENLAKSLSEGIMVGHNKYPMPVFQLGPDEIADLVAYLRTIQEPPAPSATPVKP
ncbi:MAG TPA: cytochrome c [Alphaproteobacteria bacterium]|nr:cytochrome c [Alphaproteobacteria bacterium]